MTRPGLLCLLSLLVWASACTHQKVPSGVLSKEEYARYLVSVYVAEAKLNTYAITPDSAMKLYQPFERALIEKLGVTDSAIHNTYQYYLAHPDQMELVYTSVIDTLNLLEQKASNQVP